MIYFDHNATSPLHPAAREAWLTASEQWIGNPASEHRLGQRAEIVVEQARTSFADSLGCQPSQIVFTSGASEASNTVLHHFASEAEPDDEIWISAIEHAAVMEPAVHYFGKRTRLIPVEPGGVVSITWLAEQLKKCRPKLVAVMAANNETGVVQPWHEISSLCREHDVPFFCDATQWIGKLPSKGLADCDYVIGSAHKFGGPRGVGFLKIAANKKLNPLILGGKHQEGRRAGTENVAGVLALIAALKIRESAVAANEHLQLQAYRDEFEQSLLCALPQTRIIGREQPRLWNTGMAILPDSKCAFRWVVKLDKDGFAVSSGSACASGTEKPSPVLTAMGIALAEIANVVRFSAGWETTKSDWRRLLDCIVSMAKNI